MTERRRCIAFLAVYRAGQGAVTVTARRQHRRRLHDDLLHANNFYSVPLWCPKPLFTSLNWLQAGSHLPAFLPSSLLPHACLFGGAAAIQRGHCCHRWLYQKAAVFPV